jgi:hypothetical protein
VNTLTAEPTHGSSGAIIEMFDHHVIKSGQGHVGERVTQQVKWLTSYPSAVVPVVYDVVPARYMMERLDPVEPFSLNVADLDAIIGRLARYVWHREPVVMFSPKLHHEKLDRLKMHASDQMVDFLVNVRDIVLDRRQRACLTHGDPTLDNVMRRMGDFVVTDPIPATHAVPDLWAVDLGKILQSLSGFEIARYDEAPHNPIAVRPSHLLDTLTEHDRIRAIYWCVVHYMRAMPYVSDKIHDKLRRCAEYAISFV